MGWGGGVRGAADRARGLMSHGGRPGLLMSHGGGGAGQLGLDAGGV